MTFDLAPLAGEAVLAMLIFARLGTIVMLMPGIGELSIPPRIRLSFALLVTLIFFPVIAPLYASAGPLDTPGIFILLAAEMAVGFVVGFGTRLVTYALQIAGTVIANQSGLAMALAADPQNAGQQSALISSFLGVVAVTLVFTANAHHLLITALHDSFLLFPPGHIFPVGDVRILVTDTLTRLFVVAMRVSAPFLVIGLVLYFAMGLLNRLMPQLQIFFLALPFNIFAGLAVMMMVLTAMMSWYFDQFVISVGRFLVQ